MSHETAMKKFTQQEIDIYNYMEAVFEKHTKDGEKYIPEIHDPMVIEMASEKFGKTIEEIDKIYIGITYEILNTV
jgi:hypothetical protein